MYYRGYNGGLRVNDVCLLTKIRLEDWKRVGREVRREVKFVQMMHQGVITDGIHDQYRSRTCGRSVKSRSLSSLSSLSSLLNTLSLSSLLHNLLSLLSTSLTLLAYIHLSFPPPPPPQPQPPAPTCVPTTPPRRPETPNPAYLSTSSSPPPY